ncbi:MAG: hypothetical protein M3Q06_09845 [Bacteroidota bacterium]|nr:hypothetical protein [Bacteroidota bacterium]
MKIQQFFTIRYQPVQVRYPELFSKAQKWLRLHCSDVRTIQQRATPFSGWWTHPPVHRNSLQLNH